MQQLVRLFWDICLLRKGPQDVPTAPALFWLLFIIGVLIDLFMQLNFVDFKSAVILVAANTAILFGAVMLLLVIFRYPHRILQTLTTFAGTGLIFSFIRLPLMFVFKSLPDHAGIFGMIEISILFWGLIVIAHILRHALSTEFFLAAMLSIGYFMLSYQLAISFHPGTG